MRWNDINWKDQWLKFNKGDKVVHLSISEEVVIVKVCEVVDVHKEFKSSSEVLAAQVLLCEANILDSSLTLVHSTIQKVLTTISSVFTQPFELSPKRLIDHQIPLLPLTQSVNLIPYRYSYF
jgi:hypothetical protein